MSVAKSQYNMKSGPFGICSGFWDKSNNMYLNSTDTEIGACCLDSNLGTINDCYEKCPTLKTKKLQENCIKTCKDIEKSVKDNCQLVSEVWGKNNPILKASEFYGCGDGYYELINNDCLKKNKNDIITLCQKSCTSSSTIDCTEHCNYSYNLLTKPDINLLNKYNTMDIKPDENFKQVEKGGMRYVLYASLITICIFMLVFIWKKIISKI